MLDYLYYRVYKHFQNSSYGSIIHFSTPVLVALLIAFNILEVNLFFAKIDLIPFAFKDKSNAILFYIALMGISLVYYRLNYKKIIDRFSKESAAQKRRGGWLVAIYVVLTFLLFFCIAFFRPGKL